MNGDQLATLEAVMSLTSLLTNPTTRETVHALLDAVLPEYERMVAAAPRVPCSCDHPSSQASPRLRSTP